MVENKSSNAFRGNLILLVMTVGLSLLAYLWQMNQSFIEKKTTQYDETLQTILMNSTEISTKMNSNRNEWEYREGRIIGIIEKQAVTIERLVTLTNQHNVQISNLEAKVDILLKGSEK